MLNGELRVAVSSRIQGVGFLDAGNVMARASDLNLFELRPAAGFGIRIRSPVGPIRLDLGFKLDRRELSPGRLERRASGTSRWGRRSDEAGAHANADRWPPRCVVLLAAPLAAQSLLDRVVARVNGSVILLSDVRAAVMLGLVDGAAADSEDAVEQMVQRALLIEEVNRFPPPEPVARGHRRRARRGCALAPAARSTPWSGRPASPPITCGCSRAIGCASRATSISASA